MVSLTQYDFIKFCCMSNRESQRKFVHNKFGKEKTGGCNYHFHFYQRMQDFYSERNNNVNDWSFFDPFIKKHPDCEKKVNSLKTIHNRFRIIKPLPIVQRFWIHGQIQVKVDRVIHLNLDGIEHLVFLDAYKDGLIRVETEMNLSLIGITHRQQGENTIISSWQLAKPENEFLSISNLKPFFVKNLERQAETLEEMIKKLYPDKLDTPNSDDQDEAA